MANWVQFTDDVWIDTTIESSLPVGTVCFANYKDASGLIQSTAKGVVLRQEWVTFTPANYCFPAFAIMDKVTYDISVGFTNMANWLLISANELSNQLMAQSNYLVTTIGSSGGGGGGFTSADRAMLSNIDNRIIMLQNNLNVMQSIVTNKINILDTKVVNMSTNMALEHDSIEAAIVSGGGLTDDGLLSGIGDLIGSAWTWMTDMITSFTFAIGDIEQWAEAAMLGIGSSMMETMTSLVDGMTLGLSFMSGTLTFAFDNIFDLIRIPLDALGDVLDMFVMEFFEWLEGTFSIDIGEIETGAVTLLETFRRLMGNFKAETGVE